MPAIPFLNLHDVQAFVAPADKYFPSRQSNRTIGDITAACAAPPNPPAN